jgi:hypothetical protein
MDRFQYQILTGRDQMNVPGGVVWFVTSNLNEALGHQLPEILNELGSQGWELAGTADVGFTGRVELIMKRRTE